MTSVQIREVLRLTPRQRQTLLFSATMTEEVRDLAALSLQRPVRPGCRCRRRCAQDPATGGCPAKGEALDRTLCVYSASHTIACMNDGISLDVLRCVCSRSVKCAGPGRLGC